MAPEARLATLLTGSQEDVAERILRLLSLASLGCLSCASRLTRTWVDAQPEALWRAAAEREHPVSHPLFWAASVRRFLQGQHSTRACLAGGAVPSKRHVSEGVVSPDLTQYAMLLGGDSFDVAHAGTDGDDEEERVVIYDIASGQRVQRLILPEAPSFPFQEPLWLSAPAGSHLLLCCGGAWLPRNHNLCISDNFTTAGLLFLDVQTGRHCTAALHHHRQEQSADCCYKAICAGRGLVLVVPSDDKQPVMSIFDCKGSLLQSTLHPDPNDNADFSWAPDGTAVCISGYEACFVWQVASNTLIALSSGGWSAWAIPSASHLLLGQTARIAFYTCQGQPAAVPLAQQQAPQRVLAAAWGSRLALLVHTDTGSCQLQVFSVTGTFTLVFEHIISMGDRDFSRPSRTALSADGLLWAGVTGALDKNVWEWRQQRLAVVHLASGSMREFDLPNIEFQYLTFSLDCSAALVRDEDGRSTLLSFADSW